MNVGFIKAWTDFVDAKALVKRDVDTQETLPNLVLRSKYRFASFDEFDWGLSGPFWMEIRTVAEAAGDTDVLVACLNPDPIENFHKRFGCFPWFWMSIEEETADYWNAINNGPESSPSHSLLIVAETLVWTGKSGKWVVYGNRSREILVLGTTDHMEGIDWNDLDWAIERFKFVFGESPITRSFHERFEQAYRGLDVGKSGPAGE